MTRIKIGIVAVILLMSNLIFAQTLQEGKKFLYYERYNSAKESLEKAAEATPANPEIIYWLGQAWLELKQPAKA
ncbi:MAG: tetratricopeptide repeat protein, partial [Chitinophagaceae bacterium]